MPTMFNDIGYCIRLANGRGWHIIPTEGAKSWVKKLATITELKISESNGYPKLIFTQGDLGKNSSGKPIDCLDSDLQRGLPKDGWRSYELQLLRFWTHRDVPDVICEIGNEKSRDLDIARMLEAFHPIYQQAKESGGFPFHAGLVEWKGLGILLAGPGKVGKSTCCRRLPPPWHAFCDDETLIVRDDQKRYLVHPFPTWSGLFRQHSGETWNIQRYLPLSAIFFLDQAKSNGVVPLGKGEAAILINQSVKQICCLIYKFFSSNGERELKKRLFDNACELAKTIPAFTLHISLTGQFWKEIEEVLSELPQITSREEQRELCSPETSMS